MTVKKIVRDERLSINRQKKALLKKIFFLRFVGGIYGKEEYQSKFLYRNVFILIVMKE